MAGPSTEDAAARDVSSVEPPMCRGLDLLPDWDTPYIRDEFRYWCGVCT